jgi:hypothetical protein
MSEPAEPGSRPAGRSKERRAGRCPICRKPSAIPAGPGEGSPYPFCSERCRLIDLGRWLDGVYQVPVESPGEAEPPEPVDPDEG